MRVQITNDKCYSFLSDVNLDLVFDGMKFNGGVTVTGEQLYAAGAPEYVLDCHNWWFNLRDVKIVTGAKLEIDPPVKQGDAPCIREMCCNQFGERDEMQSIINSLQADVIKLEDEMTEAVFILQSDSDTKVDDALKTLNSTYYDASL